MTDQRNDMILSDAVRAILFGPRGSAQPPVSLAAYRVVRRAARLTFEQQERLLLGMEALQDLLTQRGVTGGSVQQAIEAGYLTEDEYWGVFGCDLDEPE